MPYSVIRIREDNTTSLVMRPLNRVAEVPADLISTERIWETSLEIFLEISLAVDPDEEPTMVQCVV